MVVVENTPEIHNVVVCTLCSCYPWPVLGLPPTWYKCPPYRSRMVRGPWVLLAEMGCAVPDDRRDPGVGLVGRGALPRAAAATRGPRRSVRGRAGRPGHRDAMIGVARVTAPPSVPRGSPSRPLPRSNGSPVFDAPGRRGPTPWPWCWCKATAADWDDFRRHLIAAIDDDDRRPLLGQLGGGL